MPDTDLHCKIDQNCFGEAFPDLHRAMDKPTEDLGLLHRFIFHSFADADKLQGTMRTSARLHIIVDYFLLPFNLFFWPLPRIKQMFRITPWRKEDRAPLIKKWKATELKKVINTMKKMGSNRF